MAEKLESQDDDISRIEVILRGLGYDPEKVNLENITKGEYHVDGFARHFKRFLGDPVKKMVDHDSILDEIDSGWGCRGNNATLYKLDLVNHTLYAVSNEKTRYLRNSIICLTHEDDFLIRLGIKLDELKAIHKQGYVIAPDAFLELPLRKAASYFPPEVLRESLRDNVEKAMEETGHSEGWGIIENYYQRDFENNTVLIVHVRPNSPQCPHLYYVTIKKRTMVYSDELSSAILKAIESKGWNVYDSSSLQTGEEGANEKVIRRGPVTELRPGTRYVFLPNCEDPTDPEKVMPALKEYGGIPYIRFNKDIVLVQETPATKVVLADGQEVPDTTPRTFRKYEDDLSLLGFTLKGDYVRAHSQFATLVPYDAFLAGINCMPDPAKTRAFSPERPMAE